MHLRRGSRAKHVGNSSADAAPALASKTGIDATPRLFRFEDAVDDRSVVVEVALDALFSTKAVLGLFESVGFQAGSE